MRLTSSEFIEWIEYLRLANESPEQRALREASERATDRATARRAEGDPGAAAAHVPAAGSLL